jgi:hypothetical protein
MRCWDKDWDQGRGIKECTGLLKEYRDYIRKNEGLDALDDKQISCKLLGSLLQANHNHILDLSEKFQNNYQSLKALDHLFIAV